MSERWRTAFLILIVSIFWLVYASLGGFTGLYEDIFNCPRDSECQVEP